jgi:hypothetical protein
MKNSLKALTLILLSGALAGCGGATSSSPAASSSGTATSSNVPASSSSSSNSSSSSDPVKRFTITFANYDGTELQKSDWVYGSTPVYSGTTPTRGNTDQYFYYWTGGWTPAIAKVTGAATYTAVFEYLVNEYAVTFVSNGGTAVDPQIKPYGSKADQPATPTKEGSSFQGWYKDKWLTDLWDFNADIVERERYFVRQMGG